jgi:hypothetical protein
MSSRLDDQIMSLAKEWEVTGDPDLLPSLRSALKAVEDGSADPGFGRDLEAAIAEAERKVQALQCGHPTVQGGTDGFCTEPAGHDGPHVTVGTFEVRVPEWENPDIIADQRREALEAINRAEEAAPRIREDVLDEATDAMRAALATQDLVLARRDGGRPGILALRSVVEAALVAVLLEDA